MSSEAEAFGSAVIRKNGEAAAFSPQLRAGMQQFESKAIKMYRV